jgi:Zn-dependent protease with chaperone function
MNTKHQTVGTLGQMSARVAVAAAATLAVSASAQAKLLGLSEEEEIRAGQQVAQQAQREYGRALSRNDPMQRRVTAIGRRFVSIATRKNIPYTFTVLRNDKVLNAFAAPGGPIFVTTKLVQTTANDAELAYVLGHEAAHIERRHIAKSIEKQQKVGLAAGILGAILGNKGGNLLGTAVNVTYKLWESGYSRDQERDADVIGVRMMARLGYDPRRAPTMLMKLNEGGRSGALDKYLGSHPSPASRAKAVTTQIQKENLLTVARQNGGPRLSDGGNYGTASGSYADADGSDAYPGDDYTPASTGTGSTSYPDYDGDSRDTRDGGYASNDDGYGTDDNSGRVADLGGPLRIVQREEDSVILASAAGVARWAGAQISTEGRVTTLRRGNRSISLRRYSTAATVNGRNRTLAVAPDVFDGRLYAPLGDLVQGVGGTARFDQAANAIRLTIDGRESVLQLRNQ